MNYQEMLRAFNFKNTHPRTDKTDETELRRRSGGFVSFGSADPPLVRRSATSNSYHLQSCQ